MSWDENRYKATCGVCGHEGVQIRRSNDHGQSDDRWEGFDTVPANEYEYHRKRSEARVPVCNCKSQNIIVGSLMK
jgi:hypothetical protein